MTEIKHNCKECADMSKWYADRSKWCAERSKEYAEKCRCDEGVKGDKLI